MSDVRHICWINNRLNAGIAHHVHWEKSCNNAAAAQTFFRVEIEIFPSLSGPQLLFSSLKLSDETARISSTMGHLLFRHILYEILITANCNLSYSNIIFFLTLSQKLPCSRLSSLSPNMDDMLQTSVHIPANENLILCSDIFSKR